MAASDHPRLQVGWKERAMANVRAAALDRFRRKTVERQFQEVCACETREKMVEWFDVEIGLMHEVYGLTRAQAATILSENLGWMCGYYADGPDRLEYLHAWLGIKHPIFGTPEEMRAVTPEEALEAERAWGEKIKSERGKAGRTPIMLRAMPSKII